MAGEMANSQINLANSLRKEQALAIIVTPQACGGATRGKQTTLGRIRPRVIHGRRSTLAKSGSHSTASAYAS